MTERERDRHAVTKRKADKGIKLCEKKGKKNGSKRGTKGEQIMKVKSSYEPQHKQTLDIVRL